MNNNFVPIADSGALEQLLARSHNEAVVLFKHSVTCPISSAAYREMSRAGNDVAIVVVQKARDVSNEIARRTGLRHESPQAIVLRNGEAVWSASHYDITSEAVGRAVEEHQ